MKLRVLASLLALVASGLILGAAPAGAADPDPHFEQPVVGECHNYGYAMWLADSDTSPVVPCSARHTAVVTKVLMLPDALDWTASDAELNVLYRDTCIPAFNRALGKPQLTRVLTAYYGSLFKPTQTQQDAGARWLRCDVVLVGGGKHLAPMHYAKTPLIRGSIPSSIRMCMQGSTYYYTTCTRRHAWRATGSFNVRRGTFPGPVAMKRIAIRNCSPRVKSKTFTWVAPTKEQWKNNWRTMVCYTKTHN